jgi:electron transport complex protein RnfG
MEASLRSMLGSSALLLGLALVGSTLLSVTHEATRARIIANERASLVTSLNDLLAPQLYDNDLINDVVELGGLKQFGDKAVTLYRARLAGRPRAAVAVLTAVNGYRGPITLLVAVGIDGSLAGVRVLEHSETPGIGDGIELRHGDWIHGFEGRSLEDPASARWAVRKDGGVYDQLTGATTTARAIVQAVHDFLVYFRGNRQAAFRCGENLKE